MSDSSRFALWLVRMPPFLPGLLLVPTRWWLLRQSHAFRVIFPSCGYTWLSHGRAPGFAEPVISLLRKVKWDSEQINLSSQIWLSNVGTVDDYFSAVTKLQDDPKIQYVCGEAGLRTQREVVATQMSSPPLAPEVEPLRWPRGLPFPHIPITLQKPVFGHSNTIFFYYWSHSFPTSATIC